MTFVPLVHYLIRLCQIQTHCSGDLSMNTAIMLLCVSGSVCQLTVNILCKRIVYH